MTPIQLYEMAEAIKGGDLSHVPTLTEFADRHPDSVAVNQLAGVAAGMAGTADETQGEIQEREANCYDRCGHGVFPSQSAGDLKTSTTLVVFPHTFPCEFLRL